MAAQDDIARKIAEIAAGVRNPTYQNPPPAPTRALAPEPVPFEALQRAIGAQPTGEALGTFSVTDPARGLARFMPSTYSSVGGRDVIAPPPERATRLMPYAKDVLREARGVGLFDKVTPEQGTSWVRGLANVRGTEAIERALETLQQQAAGNRQLLPGSNLPAVGPQDFTMKGSPYAQTSTYEGMPRFQVPATLRGATAAEPRAASAGPSMGDRMSKGYVPKGFWDGATERMFQPEPGPPSGIDVNAPDFRAARGLGQAVLGVARRRPMDVAMGVGAAGAGIKALYDEYGRQQAEQARPYTLAATLEAARQGRAEPSAAAQPLAAENVLAPVPGSAMTTTGNAQRTIAEDMARRTGPEAPFLSSAPGALITFPTATAAAGAPSVAGRVTPGAGRPGATPGQQRGELDLSDMSFKDAFSEARRRATREGVGATGRFLWRGDAYQTNIDPVRGRERYVPESQQTRLGNLPQLADAIAPTPQPAPAGKRITEVLPRSASVTPVAPTAAAQPQGVLESLPDYESRRQQAQALLGERMRQGEGTRDRPIQLNIEADLTPETRSYLEQHPEHRFASTNPNLQREYVQLMQQRDELGITGNEMQDIKDVSESKTLEGGSLKGTVSHFVPDKFGGHFTGGRFWAPSEKSLSGGRQTKESKSETTDEKSKFLERFADWNRRNEEWNARQEKAEAVKPSAAEMSAQAKQNYKVLLLAERQARADKNFAVADQIKQQIADIEAAEAAFSR